MSQKDKTTVDRLEIANALLLVMSKLLQVRASPIVQEAKDGVWECLARAFRDTRKAYKLFLDPKEGLEKDPMPSLPGNVDLN